MNSIQKAETMKALIVSAAHEWHIADVPIPEISKDEVLIRVSHVGLCGTDLEMLNGSHPYFQTGDANYPLRLGHEFSGTVIESYDLNLPAGTMVVVDPVIGCQNCDACKQRSTWCINRIEIGVRNGGPGGLAEFIAVPIRNVYKIPQGLSLRDATLTEPAVTAIAGISRSQRKSGLAVVVGQGTIGIIAAQILIKSGWEVLLGVSGDSGAARVQRLGFKSLSPDEMPFINADLVIEAAGTNRAIESTFKAVRAGGEVVLLGVPDKPINNFDFADVVVRDISIYGVLNGPGKYNEALSLIAERVIDANKIIDQVVEFANFSHAISLALNRERQLPKILISM